MLEPIITVLSFGPGLSLVGFLQSKKGCRFAVPVNPAPKSFAVPAHDLELCDRALMPILNFAQDSLDILGHRASPQAGVDDRDRRRCDLVSKISPRSDWIRELGIETDFVVAHSPALKR